MRLCLCALPCCCVMFLLRLGEGRSYSVVSLQLAKLMERWGSGWGCTGGFKGDRGKEARVRGGGETGLGFVRQGDSN